MDQVSTMLRESPVALSSKKIGCTSARFGSSVSGTGAPTHEEQFPLFRRRPRERVEGEIVVAQGQAAQPVELLVDADVHILEALEAGDFARVQGVLVLLAEVLERVGLVKPPCRLCPET